MENQNTVIVKLLSKEVKIGDINPLKIAEWIRESIGDISGARRLEWRFVGGVHR